MIYVYRLLLILSIGTTLYIITRDLNDVDDIVVDGPTLDKIRRSSIADQIHSKIKNVTQRDLKISKPPGLDKFYLYDESAKDALNDIFTWIYENEVETPFFSNLIADNTRRIEKPKICISISSKRRSHSPVSYLFQTVASLLSRVDFVTLKKDLYVHVFNVDSEPETYDEIQVVRELFPVTQIQNEKIPPNFPRQAQEGLAAAKLMREFAKIGCKFPIFLEDDVIADVHWLDLLNIAITEMDKRTNWLALKLYVARSRYTPGLENLRGVNNYDQGSNTVAVMVNPEHVERFANELEEMVTDAISKNDPRLVTPKDWFYSRYRDKYGLRIHGFEPVIFQHVGLFSSVQVDRTVDENFAKSSWFLESKLFDSEGIPIQFDPNRWNLSN
jgi:hypothetical protein